MLRGKTHGVPGPTIYARLSSLLKDPSKPGSKLPRGRPGLIGRPDALTQGCQNKAKFVANHWPVPKPSPPISATSCLRDAIVTWSLVRRLVQSRRTSVLWEQTPLAKSQSLMKQTQLGQDDIFAVSMCSGCKTCRRCYRLPQNTVAKYFVVNRCPRLHDVVICLLQNAKAASLRPGVNTKLREFAD